MKLLITAIIFLTKYQGREGRIYTITAALSSIALFFTVNVYLLISIFTTYFQNTENRVAFFYLNFGIFFLLFIYFLLTKKNKLRLHYNKYKIFLRVYLLLLFFPLPLYILYLLVK